MRKWLRRLPHPFPARDRAAGYRYQLSILQAEFSLTQMLGSSRAPVVHGSSDPSSFELHDPRRKCCVILELEAIFEPLAALDQEQEPRLRTLCSAHAIASRAGQKARA